MEWMPLGGRARAVTIGVAILTLSLGAADAGDEEPTQLRVARLIKDLGADQYHRRDQAAVELEALGATSREQLRQATSSPDVEVRLRATKLLDALDVEDLWAASKIDLRATGQFSGQLLRTIADRTGNRLYLGDPYGNLADVPLDVDYRGTAYLEALDDLCNRSGNRIRFYGESSFPGVVISEGEPGRHPRAYGGPARAQIVSARRTFIEELKHEDHASELTSHFQLQFKLNWEDRLQVVGYAAAPVVLEAVTDTGVVVGARAATPPWIAAPANLRDITATVAFNPVPIAARRLTSLKVRWGLAAIAQPRTLSIASPAAGQQQIQDDVQVTVNAVEPDGAGRFALSITVLRDLPMPEPAEILLHEYDVKLLDESGRAFALQNRSEGIADGAVQMRLSFTGSSAASQPATLVVAYPRLRAKREIDLVFHDVPLPATQPD